MQCPLAVTVDASVVIAVDLMAAVNGCMTLDSLLQLRSIRGYWMGMRELSSSSLLVCIDRWRVENKLSVFFNTTDGLACAECWSTRTWYSCMVSVHRPALSTLLLSTWSMVSPSFRFVCLPKIKTYRLTWYVRCIWTVVPVQGGPKGKPLLHYR